MHISGKKLDADYFVNLSVGDVAEVFGLPLSKEKEIMPAVTQMVL
jgi:hypothetical protein